MDRFDGTDYTPVRDDVRLSNQHDRLLAAVKSGAWLTLNQLSDITGDPPASISAQLRHLRKPRFGSNTVEKRYVADGLYEYRVLLRQVKAA